MNIEESIKRIKKGPDLSWSDSTEEIDKKLHEREIAINNLITAYEKEKEKNKTLEQENKFLKTIYRGTDEFKAIEKFAKGE